ncbi:hypothetical protein [Silvanigrella aquatica]|uniref:Uncharacterized protein n=1 Tax=Silvanigrella aquatica TaxID=1915309 RepID=A0A1L4D1L0_9BACT|nr:hypothetical protein [Silvanigrella aquatica]APJ04074.1 hypothetical protein AXG55_09210 [Silvanigrella aquatica]
MYLIYDFQRSIMQFSYCNIDESHPMRGVYGMQSKMYFFSSDIFYFSYKIELKNYLEIPDMRIELKNIFFIKMASYFFSFISLLILIINKISNLFFQINLNKIKIIKRIGLFFLLSVILFKFFIIDYYKENLIINKKIEVSNNEWKNIIFNMPLSKKILKNKNLYYEDVIPSIKGINEFRFLAMMDNINEGHGSEQYLAVPYKKIISIDKNDSVNGIFPIKTCINKNSKSYSIFKIELFHHVIIFQDVDAYFMNDKVKFILAPKSQIDPVLNRSHSKSICNYLVLN